MVTNSYMLARPRAPSPLKRYVDQQVIPAAIDAAATVEAGIERLAIRTRHHTASTLAIAFAIGLLLAAAITRRG